MKEIIKLKDRSASPSLISSRLLIAATIGLTVLTSGAASNAFEPISAKPKQAVFKTQAEAEAAAPQFGCKGSHKMGDMWMVCDKHSMHMEHQHKP
ncbi:MAG: hypothetical protein AB8B35_02950 [Prochlorococcus sp.]